MKIFKRFILLCGRFYKVLMLLALAVSMVISMLDTREFSSLPPIEENSVSEEILNDEEKAEVVTATESEELRAVWVPCMSLTGISESEEKFREEFSKIADNSANLGMNALVVHVRPFCDALYKSSYYPWSHILTGEQGKDPGFDPLEIMLEICHERNMEFHAWINPLRVSNSDTLKTFSEDNPYMIWTSAEETKDYIMYFEKGIYLNPAYEEVRKYIISGVREIIENYEVDGIHFDDYFYPANSDGIDEKAYNYYVSNVSSDITLHDFRKQNINALIAGVYKAIKEKNKNISFGISPQGNIHNNYLFSADIESWGAVSGYVDYLCPQMYVSLEHPSLPFEETLSVWRDMVSNEDVKLYVGLGVYKAGTDADGGTWQNRDDVLATQLTIGRNLKYDGVMFYSYDYLFKEETKEEIENVVSLLN